MKNKQKIHRFLYQNYREFVEFMNDLSLPTIIYLVLMYLPSFTIFGDLVQHVSSTHFISNFSVLSLASLLFRYTVQSPWLKALLIVYVLFMLLIPIYIVLLVVLYALSKANDKSVEIGYFNQVYQQSNFCQIARLHFNLFQRLYLPMMVSFAVKIVANRESDLDVFLGILIIVLAFLNSLFFQYYSLQVSLGRGNKIQQKHINFPYGFLETIFIITTIVVINVTPTLTSFVCCVCFFLVRSIISHVCRFENQKFYPEYQFSLFVANCVAVALLIGHLNSQPSIMMACAIITVLIMIKAKRTGIFHSSKYSVVDSKLEIDQISIEDVKNDLRAEKIAKTFKEAVWISRRKNSHREELTIDIIKSKCYQLECESRGSTKVVNSLLLLEYEIKIVDIIKKTLHVQQKAIQALTILKSKEPKQELLSKTVVQLADLISEGKEIFIQCVKINALAPELTILMHLFFKQLYNDGIFLKEIKGEYHNQTSEIFYKRVQKQLFSREGALVVVNIMDEVGKITKVSNNMPNVLGYPSHTLVGLSINELIPLSVRKVHDNIINTFVDNFTSDVMRQKPSVEFYAYDKMFHLQKVEIRYKFFLHFFENLELSSVVRKQKTDDYLILTDQFGNIEGWTAQVGELFNFDELSGNDCNAYNIMPLVPAYIKYENRAEMKFKTLFFRLSKMKTPKLMLLDSKKQSSPDEVRKKQIQTFNDLLQKGDVIEAFYVSIEIQIKRLQRYDKVLKIIKLTDIKRIENFQKIENAILQCNEEERKGESNGNLQFDFNSGMQQDKSFDESEDAQFSILKSNNVESLNVDLNFSLDPAKGNTLSLTDLKLNKDTDRFQSIFSTRSLLKLEYEDNDEDLNTINQNLTIESNFDPKLERNSSMIWLVTLITSIVISLIIVDEVSLQTTFDQLKSNKTEMFKANRAGMIYYKSVFNPNETYISEFDSGQLFIMSSWLLSNNQTYVSYDGNAMSQNEFYLLNVQIPSTLDKISTFKGLDNPYIQEIQSNFYGIVQLYQKTYNKFMDVWNEEIQYAKAQCGYKMIVFSIGALFYLGFYICIHRSYKNQRKMTEAFFKFQRQDLNHKINSIKSISTILEKRCLEWFIDQYLNEIKKDKKEIVAETNYSIKKETGPFNTGKSQHEIGQKKPGVQASNEIEVKIEKKRLHQIMILIVVVLATQILFLILHGVLNSSMLNSCKDILKEFDVATKLIVYPNLKMASLSYPTPGDILGEYQASTLKTLNEPIIYMPNLYNLLSEKPCEDCPFMSEILNTNYRSFYSYFMQIIDTNLTESKFKELYYAVDVVVEKITNSFETKPIPSPRAVIVIYFFSIVVFFVSVIIILCQLESEYLKLECFLKFFDIETLLKNKHMSTVMAKNM